MKKTIIVAAISLFAVAVKAQNHSTFKDKKTIIQVGKVSQNQDSVPASAKTIIRIGASPMQDSVELKGKTIIQVGKTISIRSKNSEAAVSLGTRAAKRVVSIGFVFDHVDLGFSRYLDNGSFTLSPANSFLEFEPAKTSNFGFDFFEFKYKSSPGFSLYLAAGLDWNHIRLVNNVTIQKNQSQLTTVSESINFTKNRFSSRYLRIPIGFEFNQKVQNGKYLHFVLGPEFGFLLNGKVKQISKERGKEKFKDDYNFNPFRYGAHVRIGYQNTGIFAKYYFNDVFAKNQGPADFKNMSFGLTWGF